jgi:hypothetical protein
MPTILNGQLDLSMATEGVALASTTDVASFTVNNLTDAASTFTATINWGDGTTTTGTVVGSNGSFTVEGRAHLRRREFPADDRHHYPHRRRSRPERNRRSPPTTPLRGASPVRAWGFEGTFTLVNNPQPTAVMVLGSTTHTP